MELDLQGIFILSSAYLLIFFLLKHRRIWSILKLIFGRHLQGPVVATRSQEMEGMFKSPCVADWLEPKGDGGLARVGWPRSTLSAQQMLQYDGTGEAEARSTKRWEHRAQRSDRDTVKKILSNFKLSNMRDQKMNHKHQWNILWSDLKFSKRHLVRLRQCNVWQLTRLGLPWRQVVTPYKITYSSMV